MLSTQPDDHNKNSPQISNFLWQTDQDFSTVGRKQARNVLQTVKVRSKSFYVSKEQLHVLC